MKPQISVVIPMLNESKSIGPLFDRLFPVLAGLPQTYEVIAIDDGSTDGTAACLEAEVPRRPGLRVLILDRNQGQHAAILTGFEQARGEWLITLDADLQNPPEEIPNIVAAFAAGHDLVNTRRLGRQDTLFRRYASRLVNELVRRCSGIILNDFGCMLRGYHRDLSVILIRARRQRTFLPALAMVHAARPIEIPVAHAARAQGESKYSLIKLLSLQLDLLMDFSVTPLRLLFGVGVLLAAGGIGLGALLLALRIAYGSAWALDGVFTLFALLFFFVGAQFFALGLLGEYIGRIYQEVRPQPPCTIRVQFEQQPNYTLLQSPQPVLAEAP